MVHRPTLVPSSEIGKVTEIVCADSSTIVRSADCGRIYAWGRGHSIERDLDVSRFKPKELSMIETQHRFLVPPITS